jgi:hypothetical protein
MEDVRRESLAKGGKALQGDSEKSKRENRYAVFAFDAAPP